MGNKTTAEHRISLSDMYESLYRVGIDPKQSLDNRAGTALFNDPNVTIGRWYYPPDMIPWPAMPDPQALASEVITRVVTDVAGFAASYLGEKIGDLLSPPSLGDIIGLAGEQIGSYIIGPKELADNIINTQESRDDQNETEALMRNIGQIKEKVDKQVGNVKEKVFGLVDQAAEWMESIRGYICEGPEWVEAQANNVDSRAVKEIAEQIDIRFEKLRAEKKKFIHGLSEKWARKQAGKINETIYEALFDSIKRVEQLVQKAKNIAMGVAKDALLYLKALMGL